MPGSNMTPPPSRTRSSSTGVAELADKRGVSMTEISLAWLLQKVTSPVVGATKLSHVEGCGQGGGPLS